LSLVAAEVPRGSHAGSVGLVTPHDKEQQVSENCPKVISAEVHGPGTRPSGSTCGTQSVLPNVLKMSKKSIKSKAVRGCILRVKVLKQSSAGMDYTSPGYSTPTSEFRKMYQNEQDKSQRVASIY
jgi:hypothetical protein